MNKFKNKIFLVLFSILTISVLSFIFIFNTKRYLEEKRSIINSMNVAIDNINDIKKKEKREEPPKDNIKFMDYTIYTILLDKNDNIKEIINHSNNSLSNSDISKIAKDLLKNNNIKNEKIGILYFSNYSYHYINGKVLVILDNKDIKNKLINELGYSLLIFSILEAIIYFISKMLTDWIVIPVKRSFDMQKEFIADASHELKTPLSVIVASSEALEENIGKNKWLTNIKVESSRMNDLISDLLELAYLEQKNLNLNEENLSKIVELSTLTFEGIAFENNIKINYDISENIKMKMNENNIKQLIEILLDNAIKHSIKDGEINVSLKEESKEIELLVKNKGDAIPDGEEEKIFERFYRVDKSRNRSDNRYGLGLAIARKIVLNHNGQISASSSNGITTFKVLFIKR